MTLNKFSRSIFGFLILVAIIGLIGYGVYSALLAVGYDKSLANTATFVFNFIAYLVSGYCYLSWLARIQVDSEKKSLLARRNAPLRANQNQVARSHARNSMMTPRAQDSVLRTPPPADMVTSQAKRALQQQSPLSRPLATSNVVSSKSGTDQASLRDRLEVERTNLFTLLSLARGRVEALESSMIDRLHRVTSTGVASLVMIKRILEALDRRVHEIDTVLVKELTLPVVEGLCSGALELPEDALTSIAGSNRVPPLERSELESTLNSLIGRLAARKELLERNRAGAVRKAAA
jgi:hypothetical protein